MVERDEHTDALWRLMGRDPALVTADTERKFGSPYARSQTNLRRAVELGGDPTTVRIEDGRIVMDLLSPIAAPTDQQKG